MKGIYGIINTNTNKIYVGQSSNLNKRLQEHKCNLNSNTYNKPYYKNWKSLKALQDDYNQDNNYQFIILQEDNSNNLNNLEDSFIIKYRDLGYTVFNVETNQEKIQRLSQPMKPESIAKMKTNKHVEQYKPEIMLLTTMGYSSRKIAERLNISHTLVCRYNNRWRILE